MTEQANANPINLEEILSTALAQKEALLNRHPKLRGLQEEIDTHLSPKQPLGERFLTMAMVHARFQGPPVF